MTRIFIALSTAALLATLGNAVGMKKVGSHVRALLNQNQAAKARGEQVPSSVTEAQFRAWATQAALNFPSYPPPGTF